MYKAGGFDFPTVTGSFTVTGLGFRPQAVVMFGGNRPEVGTLVTGLAGPGLFMSLNALDYSDGTTIQSLTLSPNGTTAGVSYRGAQFPISMQTSASGANVVDYRADAITFDSDGFTLNVTNAATGVRPIHWLAWGSNDLETMFTGAVQQQMPASPASTFSTSFQGVSTLVLSTIANNGFGEGFVNGSAWFSWGSGHYPVAAVDVLDWQSSAVWTQRQDTSPLGLQGFTDSAVFSGSAPDDLNVSEVTNSLGPVLVEGFRRHRPDSIGSTTMNNNGGGANAYQYAVWWTGEGWTDYVTTDPDVGDTVVVPHPATFPAFSAVLFSTINGAGTSGGATETRFGFGVLTDDYQGCVVFGADGSFYQSTDECVATCTAGGVNTASGVISGGSFILTTEQGGSSADIVWHGFAAPAAQFLPQIYRRW